MYEWMNIFTITTPLILLVSIIAAFYDAIEDDDYE